MKRETGYCFSVLFLFIDYSSTLHQRMKGNERKTVYGTERKYILFSLAATFFSLPKIHDEKPMKE